MTDVTYYLWLTSTNKGLSRTEYIFIMHKNTRYLLIKLNERKLKKTQWNFVNNSENKEWKNSQTGGNW